MFCCLWLPCHLWKNTFYCIYMPLWSSFPKVTHPMRFVGTNHHKKFTQQWKPHCTFFEIHSTFRGAHTLLFGTKCFVYVNCELMMEQQSFRIHCCVLKVLLFISFCRSSNWNLRLFHHFFPILCAIRDRCFILHLYSRSRWQRSRYCLVGEDEHRSPAN